MKCVGASGRDRCDEVGGPPSDLGLETVPILDGSRPRLKLIPVVKSHKSSSFYPVSTLSLTLFLFPKKKKGSILFIFVRHPIVLFRSSFPLVLRPHSPHPRYRLDPTTDPSSTHTVLLLDLHRCTRVLLRMGWRVGSPWFSSPAGTSVTSSSTQESSFGPKVISFFHFLTSIFSDSYTLYNDYCLVLKVFRAVFQDPSSLRGLRIRRSPLTVLDPIPRPPLLRITRGHLSTPF